MDSIVYEIGADPEVSLLRYERGEIDVIADGVPSGEIARVATDAILGGQFLNTRTYLTAFIGFNNETPPCDDPNVCKAIAMAVDRNRLIQLASNTAKPAYDWYPPSHYNCSTDAEDPLYPYDPEAARQLLAEAGYPDRFTTEGWFRVVRPWLSRIPEAVQQDLAAIGIEVDLLQLESAVATEIVRQSCTLSRVLAPFQQQPKNSPILVCVQHPLPESQRLSIFPQTQPIRLRPSMLKLP